MSGSSTRATNASRYFDTHYFFGGAGCAFLAYRAAFPRVQRQRRTEIALVFSVTAPPLSKIPFVRWLPGTRYVGPHAMMPIRLSEITGVLLHFKFLENFFERVNIEAIRKEH